ncbi:unnamed protein product [Notodromas monacha]|uniref:U3 small nucleolar RNA-associated protein 14 n=1 Tax=Notodromas monacha TaxID=399045 RepID=A0A7R9G945_9CRUS|nr:unnamed protein product [Notodromas monacha]CAG0912454.1 unnamed protein product [Notodromas monacha]
MQGKVAVSLLRRAAGEEAEENERLLNLDHEAMSSRDAAKLSSLKKIVLADNEDENCWTLEERADVSGFGAERDGAILRPDDLVRVLVDEDDTPSPTADSESGSGLAKKPAVAECGPSRRHAAALLQTLSGNAAGGQRGGPVSAPLPKSLEDRLRRHLAYESAAGHVARWDATVARHRRQDQLVFPLDNPKLTLRAAEDFVRSSVCFSSKTKSDHDDETAASLEQRLEAALAAGKHEKLERKKADKVEDAEEEEEDKKRDSARVRDMEERRNKMARFRALQSYHEARQRREKRIKSRSFHRHAKKERLRRDERLLATGGEGADAVKTRALDELDRRRVAERMSLKHRPPTASSTGGGRWAQALAIRAKHDPEARKALAEQLRLSKQLTEKRTLGDESSGDEEESDARRAIEGENHTEKPVEDDGLWENIKERNRKDARMKEEKKNKRRKTAADINPSDFVSVKEVVVSGTQAPDEMNVAMDALDDDDVDGQMDEQQQYGGMTADLVAEAFAADDVVAELAQAELDEGKKKDKKPSSGTEPPGWGCWGGKRGVVVDRTGKRGRRKARGPIPSSTDRPSSVVYTVGHTVLSSRRDAAARRFQVSELPFPYNNVVDYENSVRAPIGSTFVPETAATALRVPRVRVHKGAIIEPLKDIFVKKS